MKKALSIALLLALVLILAAGCGDKGVAPNGQGSQGNNTSKIEITESISAPKPGAKDSTPPSWPAAELPPGFPVYPGGDIDKVEQDETGLYICVTETDKATYDAYLKTLEAAGWILDLSDEDTVSAVKGSWILSLCFDKDLGISLMATDMGFDLALGSFEWPKDLPFTLPVYPDGEIDFLSREENGKLRISIVGSSKDTFEKYLDMVAEAGWEFMGEIDSSRPNTAEKDGWILSLDLTDETEIAILVLP